MFSTIIGEKLALWHQGDAFANSAMPKLRARVKLSSSGNRKKDTATDLDRTFLQLFLHGRKFDDLITVPPPHPPLVPLPCQLEIPSPSGISTIA
jgi:hypothetical protein